MYNASELINLLQKKNCNIDVHHHDALFTVEDSKKLRGKIVGTHSKNLFLKKNVPYHMVPKLMIEMDILTLPYTKIVKSAGEVDDISKYTSPLKLFDYLAVGKMIISSDLKVLREIITKKNAFFIKNYENIYEWKKNIIKIRNNYLSWKGVSC